MKYPEEILREQIEQQILTISELRSQIAAMEDSLRDWTAGQALAGWLAGYTDNEIEHPAAGETSAKLVARFSYKMADAMLAERLK